MEYKLTDSTVKKTFRQTIKHKNKLELIPADSNNISNKIQTTNSISNTTYHEKLDQTQQKLEDSPKTAVLDTMGFDVIHPDDLAQQLSLHPADIYAVLLDLELAGIVVPMSGGRYQRIR